MKKLTLSDIQNGALLSEAKAETIEFVLQGEMVAVDVWIKPLSYQETEQYYQQLRDGNVESIAPEWIAKSIVDEEGKTVFKAAQVRQLFNQQLMNAVLNKIFQLNTLAVDDEKKQ